MEIQNFISKDLIELDYEAETREMVLQYMAETLQNKGYAKSTFPEAILDREKNYPSAIAFSNKGIAIPHTDATHVEKSTVFFLRLSQPLEFRAMGTPEEKVDVSFVSMFALKEKNDIGQVLTTLITAYQDPDLLEQLWIAKSKDEVYELLINKMLVLQS